MTRIRLETPEDRERTLEIEREPSASPMRQRSSRWSGISSVPSRFSLKKVMRSLAMCSSVERGEIAVILLASPTPHPRFGFRPGLEFGLQNPYAGGREDGFVVAEADFMIEPLDDEGEG